MWVTLAAEGSGGAEVSGEMEVAMGGDCRRAGGWGRHEVGGLGPGEGRLGRRGRSGRSVVGGGGAGGQRDQDAFDDCGDGGVAVGCPDAGAAVGLFVEEEGDVGHGLGRAARRRAGAAFLSVGLSLFCGGDDSFCAKWGCRWPDISQFQVSTARPRRQAQGWLGSPSQPEGLPKARSDPTRRGNSVGQLSPDCGHLSGLHPGLFSNPASGRECYFRPLLTGGKAGNEYQACSGNLRLNARDSVVEGRTSLGG